MEIQHKWITLLCCAALATVVKGFARGPPPETCDSMQPGHGFSNQDLENSPYRVSFASDTYGPGRQITISVTGGDFKGIQCQVRNEDSFPVGRFVQIDTSAFRTLDCFGSGSAITHSNADVKDGAEFVWMAPDGDGGDLKARCTIVRTFTTYWVGVESTSISYDGSIIPDPTTTTTSTTRSTIAQYVTDHSNVTDSDGMIMTPGSESEDEEDDVTAIIIGIVAAVAALIALLGAGFWFFSR